MQPFAEWGANQLMDDIDDATRQKVAEFLKDNPDELIERLVPKMEGLQLVYAMQSDQCATMFNADTGDRSVYHTMAKHIVNHLKATMLTEKTQ
jgi:hypothetical protein